jgi:hypothetical protein
MTLSSLLVMPVHARLTLGRDAVGARESRETTEPKRPAMTGETVIPGRRSVAPGMTAEHGMTKGVVAGAGSAAYGPRASGRANSSATVAH